MVKIEGYRSDRSEVTGREYLLCAAETAECACPENCERDHSNE
jgi:hypothetical protein